MMQPAKQLLAKIVLVRIVITTFYKNITDSFLWHKLILSRFARICLIPVVIISVSSSPYAQAEPELETELSEENYFIPDYLPDYLVHAATSPLALGAALQVFSPKMLQPPFINIPKTVFKRSALYTAAALGVGAYVHHKTTGQETALDAVWMSHGEQTHSNEGVWSEAAPSETDFLAAGSPKEPKLVPAAPPHSDAADNTQDVLTLYNTPVKRMSMALSASLASILPLVSNLTQTTYGASNVALHKEFFVKMLKAYNHFNNLKASLFTMPALHQALPENIGILYRSPHSFALVETYGILQKVSTALDLSPQALQKNALTWSNTSLEDKKAFLNASYKGNHPEGLKAHDTATQLLFTSVQLEALYALVFPLVTRLMAQRMDPKQQASGRETRALMKSLALKEPVLSSQDQQELAVVKEFQSKLIQFIMNANQESRAKPTQPTPTTTRSTQNGQTVITVSLGDAQAPTFLEKKPPTQTKNSLGQQQLNNIVSVEQTKGILYSGSFKYLKHFKNTLLNYISSDISSE
ncbi:MAG: hypothetical protein OXC44_06205 [Proteobacteria bacterium]|nr:hypothetical protein [Pseudomonadota bacterium]